MRTSLQVLAATSLLAFGMTAVAASAVGQQRPAGAAPGDSARALLTAQRAVYECLHLAASPLHPMIRREGQYDFEAFVAEKRDQRPFVMAQLDRLGEWSVQDEWSVGQRVMLRVEHGL